MILYRPCASVRTALVFSISAGLDASTFTLAMAAPEVSFTCPAIVPVSICAQRRPANKKRAARVAAPRPGPAAKRPREYFRFLATLFKRPGLSDARTVDKRTDCLINIIVLSLSQHQLNIQPIS